MGCVSEEHVPIIKVEEKAKQETSRYKRQTDLSSLFYHEDGGEILFRNVVVSPHLRRYNREHCTLQIIISVRTSKVCLETQGSKHDLSTADCSGRSQSSRCIRLMKQHVTSRDSKQTDVFPLRACKGFYVTAGSGNSR